MPDPDDIIDVLCAGYACVDLNFSLPHHPGPDEKLRATRLGLCGGGPAANAAVCVARLGGRAAFAGYLGRDPFGDSHLAELRRENVDASAVMRGEPPTPVATVWIKPGGHRAIVDHRDPGITAPDWTVLPKPPTARALLIDGHQPELSAILIATARQQGIPVVLDAGSVHEGTRALYNTVDYLIASETFARQFTQEDDPATALAAMEGHAPVVAVTCGERGVHWIDDAGMHHLPAFDIEAVDTTGAGDAFHGALALGLARGLPLRKNFQQASAVGALTCLRHGAREALPRRAQLEGWLAAHGYPA